MDESEQLKSILHDEDIIKSEDGFIFNPYNPLNEEITIEDIQSILVKYNLPPIVNNIKLYKRAFIHRSHTKRPHIENCTQNIKIVEKPDNCLSLNTKSNERLEFLGDGILELTTKFYLYRRFPKENEGFMTEKKIAIVKNEAIGKIALEMNLHKWLILSKHAEEKQIRKNVKKLGCLFEAFIGALFLDFNKIDIKDEDKWFQNIFVTGPGFQFAQKFIENIFEKHIDWIALIKNDDNYKNILQVKIQKEFKVTPCYIEIEHDIDLGYKMGVYLCLGMSKNDLDYTKAIDLQYLNRFSSNTISQTNLNIINYKIVHDYVTINGHIFLLLGISQHKIKRKAEQMACFNALQLFENLDTNDINESND
jgi:dsRNA-specific ribonuclease